MNTIIRDTAGLIIGSISRGGCENKLCRDAINQGRPFHAIPRGFAATLPDYHFVTFDGAVKALEREAAAHPEKLAEFRRTAKQHGWAL